MTCKYFYHYLNMLDEYEDMMTNDNPARIDYLMLKAVRLAAYGYIRCNGTNSTNFDGLSAPSVARIIINVSIYDTIDLDHYFGEVLTSYESGNTIYPTAEQWHQFRKELINSVKTNIAVEDEKIPFDVFIGDILGSMYHVKLLSLK